MVTVLATAVYAVAFHLTYRDLVHPQQDAWGAGYRALPVSLLVLIYTCCVVPAFVMPVEFRRPTQLLFYIQYYFVFVPAAFVVFYLDLPVLSFSDATALLLWMTSGMLVLSAAYAVPLMRVRGVKVAPRLFWSVFIPVALILTGYMAWVFRSNFQLVGLAQVYDVRAALGDVIAANGNAFVLYAQIWVGNLILPLAFAIGAFSRRWLLCAATLAGYMFIFATSGQKVALMAILYIPAFYFLLRRRGRNIPAALVAALSLVLVAGYAVVALAPPVVAAWYIALLHFRTLAVQAINVGQYFVFFQGHPVTRMAHLAGVRSFVHYPYQLDIPYTLGDYFYNAPVGNNSGMWASDAIAGAGAWAIPIVSAVCAVIFWVFDCCARPFKPEFVALAAAYIGATFTNVSLGTTLVSGGFALLAALLMILPRTGSLAQCYLRQQI